MWLQCTISVTGNITGKNLNVENIHVSTTLVTNGNLSAGSILSNGNLNATGWIKQGGSNRLTNNSNIYPTVTDKADIENGGSAWYDNNGTWELWFRDPGGRLQKLMLLSNHHGLVFH